MKKTNPNVRLAELRQRQAYGKKIIDFRKMLQAIEGLDLDDELQMWLPGDLRPFEGVVAKSLRRREFLVKGRGPGRPVGIYRLNADRQTVTLTHAMAKNLPTADDEVSAMAIESAYHSRPGYDQRSGKFKNGAVIYFDLMKEESYIEEDVSAAEDGDTDAIERLVDSGIGFPPDYKKTRALEFQALKDVEAMFGVRILNEGRASGGALVCKFGVSTWADVKRVNDIISRNHVGGDDVVGLHTLYFAAQGFVLYPDEELTNGTAWGNGPGQTNGDLDDWLEQFKPGKQASQNSRPASTTNLYREIRRVATENPATRAALVPLLRRFSRLATDMASRGPGSAHTFRQR